MIDALSTLTKSAQGGHNELLVTFKWDALAQELFYGRKINTD
jgi:hypothetical protein